ncbi:MAG: hypothetical protein HQL18_03355 [Candidatus Omnitrophica bacterium]|nr:hypothetical protein [Candidatus Omnitrophota bacterium]
MSEMMCPHCRNLIYDEEALLCHFCGNSLNRSSSGFLGRMRGPVGKWIWISIALVLAISFIISMF